MVWCGRNAFVHYISDITDRSYDEAAVIDALDNSIELLSRSSSLPPDNCSALFRGAGQAKDYDAARGRQAEVSALPDGGSHMEITSLDNVRQVIDRSGYFETDVLELLPGEPDALRVQRLRYYYLDDEKNAILMLSLDVTRDYQTQQEQLARAQAETERVTEIMDSIKAGAAVLRMTSAGGLSVDSFNRQMLRMLGYDAEGLPQRAEDAAGTPSEAAFADAMTLVHPDDLEKVIRSFREHYGNREFSVEPYRMLKSDGSCCFIAEDVLPRGGYERAHRKAHRTPGCCTARWHGFCPISRRPLPLHRTRADRPLPAAPPAHAPEHPKIRSVLAGGLK